MSAKYEHGKYRLSVAGSKELQNKPVMIVSPDGEDILDNANTSYTNLSNKPKINNVTLTGNKTTSQLHLASGEELKELETTVGTKANLSIIAPDYNNNSTYAVGDLAIKSGKLYKCSTAIETAETWNAEHWTETTVAALIAALTPSS